MEVELLEQVADEHAQRLAAEMPAPEVGLPDADADLRAPPFGVVVPVVREADGPSVVLDDPARGVARGRHALDPPARVRGLETTRLARPLPAPELGVAPPPHQVRRVVERHRPQRDALPPQDGRTDDRAHASTASAPPGRCGAKSAANAFVSRSATSRATRSSSLTPRSSSPWLAPRRRTDTVPATASLSPTTS